MRAPLVVYGGTLLLFHAIQQQHSVRAQQRPLTFRRYEGRFGVGTGNQEESEEDNSATSKHLFKIVQLTDLHWGEHPSKDKGRKQDKKTANAINTYLFLEKPDLVVFSGDQISSDFYRDGTIDVYGKLIATMKYVMPNVKWCTIMGNHDDHPYEVIKNGKIVDEKDAKTSRKELLEFDSRLKGSYTQPGELSNYQVPLYLEDGTLAADIYMFDTGGGSMSKKLSVEQVDWYKDQSNLARKDGVARPAIAFQHIPTRKGFEYKDGCIGVDEEKVRKIKNKPGILEAMVEQGHTHFIGVGHNHGNGYCCKHEKKLHFCFGRHSGYGGYEGAKDRGARVYELEILMDDDMNRQFTWRSWVREDDGDKKDFYQASRTFAYESPPLPTSSPTPSPTTSFQPSSVPSVSPTDSQSPSVSPTSLPSYEHSLSPTNVPSFSPTTPVPIETLMHHRQYRRRM